MKNLGRSGQAPAWQSHQIAEALPLLGGNHATRLLRRFLPRLRLAASAPRNDREKQAVALVKSVGYNAKELRASCSGRGQAPTLQSHIFSTHTTTKPHYNRSGGVHPRLELVD